MALFDVVRLADGLLAVDCQAEFLSDIKTRFIIPLMPPAGSPPSNPRLNPMFDINGESLVLVTQLATAVRTSELRSKVASLADQHHLLTHAIGTLTGSG